MMITPEKCLRLTDGIRYAYPPPPLFILWCLLIYTIHANEKYSHGSLYTTKLHIMCNNIMIMKSCFERLRRDDSCCWLVREK